ncbi:putative membrane protein [Abditibacterium utsteinense]|uniref:Putative membrane protein n=1 Tax=Abditibacterium utsteinense TaxID=1960156 RepID=A0A2S8SQF6_9BACT|nr:vitamin K epoxide reductase family protein [Abditibacterium utsteinense]PQV63018.1 putative membrane protein [Abditibacterium utsteinense]
MQDEIPLFHKKSNAKIDIAWPHLVLSLIGIALSIYAVWAHGRIEAGQSAGCTISESISCDAVLGSKWGQFFGIPLGYYGGLFWAIVFVTAISSPGTNLKTAALQRLGVATIGLLFSLGLFYIAEFVIRKTCPICLSTHIASLVNFIFAVVSWRKIAKKAPQSS